jgi:hypothetical protein
VEGANDDDNQGPRRDIVPNGDVRAAITSGSTSSAEPQDALVLGLVSRDLAALPAGCGAPGLMQQSLGRDTSGLSITRGAVLEWIRVVGVAASRVIVYVCRKRNDSESSFRT